MVQGPQSCPSLQMEAPSRDLKVGPQEGQKGLLVAVRVGVVLAFGLEVFSCFFYDGARDT